MNLFKKSIDEYVSDLHDNNIKMKFIGNYGNFSKTLLNKIHDSEELTKNNTVMRLNLAINYGGRWDLTNAFKKLVEEHNYKINEKDITEENIEKYLVIGTHAPDL